MVVAFLHSSPKVPGINLYLNRRSARVLRIKLQSAVNILEVSTDVGHHHVPGAKLSCSVPRLKTPFSHSSLSFGNLMCVARISRKSIAAYRRRQSTTGSLPRLRIPLHYDSGRRDNK